jgi:hypothetical protein
MVALKIGDGVHGILLEPESRLHIQGARGNQSGILR